MKISKSGGRETSAIALTYDSRYRQAESPSRDCEYSRQVWLRSCHCILTQRSRNQPSHQTLITPLASELLVITQPGDAAYKVIFEKLREAKRVQVTYGGLPPVLDLAEESCWHLRKSLGLEAVQVYAVKFSLRND